MPVTYCPECDTQIRLNSSPRKGDQIICISCGAFLKVANLSPIELDWDDAEVETFEMEDDFEFDDEF
jgi:hypothetical protein